MMSAMDFGVTQTDGETVPALDMAATEQVDAGTSMTAMDAETTDASSPGPAVTAGLSRHTIEHGDMMRLYFMYIPESYAQDTPSPLMLIFHGNGGNMDDFLNEADFRDLAESEGFVLIYPQGTVLDGVETHWNPLLPSETNKSDVDDLGFVATLLDALSGNINIDETRIYATGYSNGAGFVYGLACYLNDKIAAVAPVSGSMYIEMTENCNPGHPTSVAVFNGTQDFIRPYDGFPGYLLSVEDAVGYWTGHNELANAPVLDTFSTNGLTVERSVYSGGTNGASVGLFKVIGGDHVWFDFQIDGVPFNRLIWDFVSQFDTNGLRQD
jgi:polyhydroxybutyrate depolymerase